MPRFRLWVTISCAIILALFYGLFIVSYWIQPLPARVSSPERALAQVVSSAMTLETGAHQASGRQRTVSDFMDPPADPEETLDEAIRWHEELLTISKDPVAQAHLAILQWEAGRQQKVRTELAQWESQPEPSLSLIFLVRDAYFKDPYTQQKDALLNGRFQVERAAASELLPADWFRDQLIIQLARRNHQPEQAAEKEREISLRAERLFRWHFLFALLDLCLLVLGLAAGVMLVRRWKDLMLGPASIPPAWPVSSGIAVLLRGGALGMLLIALSLFVDLPPLIQMVLLPILCLPTLLLARKHLLQPNNLPLPKALGFFVDKKRWRLLLLVVMAGMAIEIIGNVLLGIAGNLFHLPNHWTEWFDVDLAWGGPMSISLNFFQSVVIAPIFEEIIFRGLLFTTLRRRFNWTVSAVISAGIFGLVHGYGVLGFLTIFLSGMIWAGMMEKTRSLVPGMIAHALDNLIFTTGVLTMLRTG